MIDIGMRIRDLRKAKDVSGKELSITLGFTQSFLSGIENGNKKCSLDTLIAICNELNVSLSDFFAEDKKVENPYLEELINSAKTLSPDQVKNLTLFIQSLNDKR